MMTTTMMKMNPNKKRKNIMLKMTLTIKKLLMAKMLLMIATKKMRTNLMKMKVR